jgi:T-complex protein 1 subunit delta
LNGKMQAPMSTAAAKSGGDTLRRREKERDVRKSNIIAARAVADIVRTSLGPKGVSTGEHETKVNAPKH